MYELTGIEEDCQIYTMKRRRKADLRFQFSDAEFLNLQAYNFFIFRRLIDSPCADRRISCYFSAIILFCDYFSLFRTSNFQSHRAGILWNAE